MRMSRITTALAFAAVLVALLVVPTTASAQEERAYHGSTALVVFDRDAGSAARAAAHAALGARVANRFDALNIDVVTLPRGLDPAVAVGRYRALAGVASASVNKRIVATSIPNDTLFSDQWGFHNTGQTVKGSLVRGKPDFDIDGPEGWDAAFGAGSFPSAGGTRVAILDTGIDRTHVDLLNKVKACASATAAIGVVVEGSCSDDNLHGTHVAGTVAANTNNGIGVAGTAPNAELAIFKFLNAGGVGFLADEIAGLEWARRSGSKVISMSYGSYEDDGAERRALQEAYNAGLLLVAAAGNDGDDTKNYPAYYPEVMSVASTTADDSVSWFSVCNGDVEIAAPGEDIWSTFPSNSYGVISGTSMATPHVAGVAAMVMWKDGLSNTQTRSRLVGTATPVTGNDGRTECSNVEQVNLAAALGGGGGTEPPPTGEGAIAGTVTDQKAKTGLASATVSCGSAGTTTTAANGTYTLASVPVGSYTCTASKSGYVSKSLNVSVGDGTTTTADFALRKSR